LLIRRIISKAESNRIYINGRLATMQVLNSVTENLASISGQHVHQNLLKEDQHLLILDQFGGLLPLRNDIRTCFEKLVPLIHHLDKLREIKDSAAKQVELMRFQRDEILQAAVTADEDRQLEQDRLRLKNSAFLHQTVYEGIEGIYGSQGSVFERLVEIKKALERAGRIDNHLESPVEQLAEISYRLEDLVGELRGYLNQIVFDPSRLDAVEERLDVLNKLKRKYGGSLDAVRETAEHIGREMSRIENVDEEIKTVEAQLIELHRELTRKSTQLSQQREAAAQKFASEIVVQLEDLNMARSRFKAALQPLAADQTTPEFLKMGDRLITATGCDHAVFLIAPNIGEALKPLANIASGGELSRVVLAIKAILATTDTVETVIFDEVDAGIGGSTAEVVGRKLCELGRHHQVICITHLPQIAKFGQHHFRITKKVSGGRTQTRIRPLDRKGRVEEIARMLGGVEITRATLDHAAEMLKD
jgi:DNA repair protein RecN (Recombination protein N)